MEDTDLTRDNYPTSYNDTPNSSKNDDGGSGNVFLYSVAVLLEIVGLVCIALVVVWTDKHLNGFAWDGSGKMFNWHPVFMVIGMIFLYGNAAIIYRLLRNQRKYTVKLVHSTIHFAIFIFTVLGLYAVFEFHNAHKIPNVYSLHSWIGLTTVVLFSCQLLLGFLGFLYPKFSDNARAVYLTFHTFFGGFIFAMAIVAAISGITEKMLFAFMKTYSHLPPVAYVANFLGLFIVIFAMLVAYILHNPDFKRVDP